MEAASGMGGLLGAAGASLALAFIVLLGLGIVLLTVLYVGSAVVVLERFARAVRRPAWVIFFALGVALLAAAILLKVSQPELSAQSWSSWWQEFLPATARLGGVTAIAVSLSWLALSKLRADNLGVTVVAMLGLGIFPMAANVLPPLWLLAALGIGCGLLALFRWRRLRRSEPDTSPSERILRWLIVASVIGIATIFAPGEQRETFAMAGSTLVALFFGTVLLGLLPLAAAGIMEMVRSVEWFIAIRYLVAKRRQVFISAISAICVGGIAAGVWLIVVVLSVMNGFERTWRDEILGNRAHFTVHSGVGPFEDYDAVLEQVRKVEGVTGASPYIDAEGMVRGGQGQIYSVRVRGIDPATVGDVTDLRQDLIRGSVDALVADSDAATGGEAKKTDPGIVIGNQLAVTAGVGVGDPLLLISPFGGPQTPLGPAPRLKRFRVVGVFESSFFQYDEVYTYVSIPAAQDFRRAEDVVDGIEARTTDFYRSRRVGAEVKLALGYPYYTRDWKDFFPAFFQALKSERVMMFLLLTMIMVVAAFLIVATLIMMIMEKSSDIAILKAMGAEDSAIERIFAIEGTLIGLAGTGIGVLAGIAVTRQLTWIQSTIEEITGVDTLPASVYQFSTLPTQVDSLQIGLVAGIAMVLSLGATLLPSRQGARLDPAEGLRYE
jgi:lipoprotein-releasing system permease protein